MDKCLSGSIFQRVLPIGQHLPHSGHSRVAKPVLFPRRPFKNIRIGLSFAILTTEPLLQRVVMRVIHLRSRAIPNQPALLAKLPGPINVFRILNILTKRHTGPDAPANRRRGHRKTVFPFFLTRAVAECVFGIFCKKRQAVRARPLPAKHRPDIFLVEPS